jgi:hypothetical protein
MLDVGACSTSLHVRTEVVFERNIACPFRFSRERNAHFVPNRPFQLSLRNTCISGKKTVCVRKRRSILHIVSL